MDNEGFFRTLRAKHRAAREEWYAARDRADACYSEARKAENVMEDAHARAAALEHCLRVFGQWDEGETFPAAAPQPVNQAA